jgi:hypothetical protein
MESALAGHLPRLTRCISQSFSTSGFSTKGKAKLHRDAYVCLSSADEPASDVPDTAQGPIHYPLFQAEDCSSHEAVTSMIETGDHLHHPAIDS